MIEALGLEALAVLLAIVAAVALKAFATWWASDPEQARTKRRERDQRMLELLKRPGAYAGDTRKRWATTEEYGAWPDRLRLQMQMWVWLAMRRWSPRWQVGNEAVG